MNIKNSTKQKNIILIPLLIISLVVFYCPVLPVLAEGEETPPAETPIETPVDPPAETQSETPIPEPEPTVIETGDAQAEVDVENEVNTNITELGDTESVDPPTGETCGEEELATGGENFEEITSESEEVEELIEEEETSLEVENENEAVLENEIETGADTGDNEADENGGDAIIETGDAEAIVNLSNLANTNITGSNFWFSLSNFFEDLIGDVHFNGFQGNENNDCGLIDCIDSLKVSNDNSGSIVNDLEIYALTGANSANNNQGRTSIHTGSARVRANLFNMLNTNITGSDWFFSILNSFGDWYGNLVLPGKEAMKGIAERASSSGSDDEVCCGNQVSVENNNQAEVENNVNVVAETGDNSADGNSDGSSINTGSAQAETNVLDIVNNNIFGDNWVMAAVKVLGNWTGRVFSVPEGVSWLRTPDGIILFNDDLGETLSDLYQENQADGDSEGISSDITNNNLGTVINNLNLLASTGDNSANGNGNASINTGDASAVANVVNFVNNNIIGRNWLFALVNVFGDWQGDLAFGQPDCLIAESAVTSTNPARPGGEVTYTLTYFNNGDADATGVTLTDDFDEKYLTVADSGGGTVIDNPGEIRWDLGTVPVGGSGSISYSVAITPEMSYGTTYLINQSTINSFEGDANNQDNTDTLTIGVSREPSNYVPVGTPELQITKTANVSGFVYAGSAVDYTITLTNLTEGTAYDVMVTDALGNGDIINTYNWYLGSVFGKEEITINYTVEIGAEIPAGFYTNIAQATGVDGYGSPVVSSEGSVTIEIKIPPFVETSESEEQEEEAEEVASLSEPLIEEVASASETSASASLEQFGNVGIGKEFAAIKIDEEAPEVLGAKTSGLKLGILSYSQFEFDEWIYIVLFWILLFAAVMFIVLYLNDRRKVRE